MSKNKYGQVAGAAYKVGSKGQTQAGDYKSKPKTKAPKVPISLNTSQHKKGNSKNTSSRFVK